MNANVDFFFPTVVIGADLDAVEYAHQNDYCLIKNREPYHHSYDLKEEIWAQKMYELQAKGLVPFTDMSKNIRILPENNILKVFTSSKVYTVGYSSIKVFDDLNVEGFSLDRQLSHYCVVDWFDCHGLRRANLDTIETGEALVSKVKFFNTPRIDGDHKYLDLFCESHLTKDQLQSFEYSDTMAKFKLIDLLCKNGFKDPKLSFWKREVYPVYKTNYKHETKD